MNVCIILSFAFSLFSSLVRVLIIGLIVVLIALIVLTADRSQIGLATTDSSAYS